MRRLLAVLLCSFLIVANAFALATTRRLTMQFTGPSYPAQGTEYVAEIGPITVSCKVVGIYCAFPEIDASVWNAVRSYCIWPRAHPEWRGTKCTYLVDIAVKQPKRRALRKR